MQEEVYGAIQGAKACNKPEYVNDDPWKHRSSGMRCRKCMWFALKVQDGYNSIVGRCRRHAPTMSGYPVVYDSDWCGDHKLDETK